MGFITILQVVSTVGVLVTASIAVLEWVRHDDGDDDKGRDSDNDDTDNEEASEAGAAVIAGGDGSNWPYNNGR